MLTCIHSTVSNFQCDRNPWLKDTCVLNWEQHTTDDETTQRGSSVHQYNVGTMNTDFQMSVFRQTSVFLQPDCFYADNVLTV